MPMIPASAEEYDVAQRTLRQEVRAPRAEARNVALAAETSADSYFSFGGVQYKVPPLPYKLGVQLQEVQLTIEDLVKAEAASKDLDDLNHEQKIEHLQLLLRCYEQALALFWVACYPLAFWKRRRHRKVNPFAECTSQEIGELLGFFFMCRMKSRVDIQGSLASRPSLSMSTPRTT